MIDWLLVEPDWPLSEVLRLETDIITAHDGTEQRVAVRKVPRRKFAVVWFGDDDHARAVRGGLYTDLLAAAAFTFPAWSDGIAITTDAGPATTVLLGDFTNTEILTGSSVVLQSTDGAAVLLSVFSMTSTQVVFAAGIGITAPPGSIVYPSLSGYTLGGGITQHPSGAGSMEAVVEVEGAARVTGSGATVNTYNSLSVLDRPHFAAGKLGTNIEGGATLVDFGGVADRFAERTAPVVAQQRRWHAYSRAEVQWWRAFFLAVAGRREPFYASTFQHDLVLDTATSPSDTSLIVVDPTGISEYWADTAYKHVALTTLSGVIYREVTAVTPGAGIETLTIAALPADVPGSTVTKISFLEKCRLTSDELNFEHYGWRAEVVAGIMVVNV